jgi:hypothetical protein
MPKDYQEVERIVEEIFDTEYIGGNQPNLNKDYIRQALTTYGNARELQGVEKVEKEIQEVLRGRYTREDDIILNHIAKVKSELK